MEDTEYKEAYDKAAADLDAAAQAIPADPVIELEKEPVKQSVKDETPDLIAELTARAEKAEKIAKDNQAWATRTAQEAAQLRREREAQERAATKPAILDANPELADAIRYVAHDPAPARQQQDRQAQWVNAVETAHPGIFSTSIDPELEKSLMTRLGALDEATRGDPLQVIREITEEKLAFTERQLGKRFAAESAKLAQKSAMSVPGAGAGSGMKTGADAALDEVRRIQNMSVADFQKEVRKAKGY